MRFKRLILIPCTLFAFILVLLSFRSILVDGRTDQEDKKAGTGKEKTKQTEKEKKSLAADAAAKKAKDSLIGFHPYWLEMRGVIRQTKLEVDKTQKGPLLDSAEIRVYTDSCKLVGVHYSSKHGECRFKLPLNRKIRIEIRKKGFVSKFIEVNSAVPPDKKIAYLFPFDIDLFEEIPGLDVRVLKKPIAKVKFDHEKMNFEYDEAYTSTVNHDLKILYKAYREGMDSTHHPKKKQ
jgi:hypothetical protein